MRADTATLAIDVGATRTRIALFSHGAITTRTDMPTLELAPRGTGLGDGVSLGVGAQSVCPWNGDGVVTPGVIGRIGLLQERLAITFGIRSLSFGHRDAVVALSVSDLNGLAYWLALWGAARK